MAALFEKQGNGGPANTVLVDWHGDPLSEGSAEDRLLISFGLCTIAQVRVLLQEKPLPENGTKLSAPWSDLAGGLLSPFEQIFEIDWDRLQQSSWRKRPLSFVDPNIEHIPLKLLWRFRAGVDQLTTPGFSHVVDCQECRAAWKACIRSDSFEAAERELKAAAQARIQETPTTMY